MSGLVRVGALAGAAALAGCATLPTSGPTGGQIVHDAGRADGVDFSIVDITRDTVSPLSVDAVPSGALAMLAADGTVDRLGPGDVLSVDIYEVGYSLFGGRASIGGASAEPGAEAVGSGSGSVPGVVVDAEGNITVPYAGTIHVAGLTLAQAQQRILSGLRGKSQSPQVVVRLLRNVANSVVVMGAIAEPGRVPLTLAHERLLDVIAERGGISRAVQTGGSTATGTGPHDMIVRFTRDGRTAEQPLDAVVVGSADDLVLLGGDRIDLVRQPRTYSVMGAIDRVSQVPFESRHLTLAQALARAGGPSDARADPRSIFVFRLVGTAGAPEQARPVVYRLNMKQAQGFFLAQQFAMRDGDVLYVANASANQPIKLSQIVGSLFSPFVAARAITQ